MRGEISQSRTARLREEAENRRERVSKGERERAKWGRGGRQTASGGGVEASKAGRRLPSPVRWYRGTLISRFFKESEWCCGSGNACVKSEKPEIF